MIQAGQLIITANFTTFQRTFKNAVTGVDLYKLGIGLETLNLTEEGLKVDFVGLIF